MEKPTHTAKWGRIKSDPFYQNSVYTTWIPLCWQDSKETRTTDCEKTFTYRLSKCLMCYGQEKGVLKSCCQQLLVWLTDLFAKAKGVSNPGSNSCMHAASVLSEPWVSFTQWTPSRGKQLHHCILKETPREPRHYWEYKGSREDKRRGLKVTEGTLCFRILLTFSLRQRRTAKAITLPLQSEGSNRRKSKAKKKFSFAVALVGDPVPSLNSLAWVPNRLSPGVTLKAKDNTISRNALRDSQLLQI